jgi:hypothetical protein
MAIHSFYVIAWDSGQPLYSRTWVEVADNPTLLSGLLASVELLALKITEQHVDMVTMRNSRFFFKVDNENGILLVFITDIADDPTRFGDYLDMLHNRFLENFSDVSSHIPVYQRDPRRASVFDELVDSLISHWETAEASLRAAKIMDLFDLFTQFYNVTLQHVLTDRSREMHFTDIQRILSTHLKADRALRLVTLDKHGVISFDQVDPDRVKLQGLDDILSTILKELVAIVRRTRRRQSYETLFFEHYVPLIKVEQARIEEYDLQKKLVMELL